jgi:hypothetical protein
MGGLAGGFAGLILLDVVLRRAPARFAGNVLGPVTAWLAAWMSPDVPLIPPAATGGVNRYGGWATVPGRRHPPPILGPNGRRPL